MTFLRFLPIFSLVPFALSCNTQKDKLQEIEDSELQFVLKDSVVVDFLGDIHITDYDEASKA